MPVGTLLQFLLPRFLVVPIASFLGTVSFLLNERQRSRLIENYRHILGAKTPDTVLRKTALQAFRNLAVFYADLLRIPVMKRRVARLGELNSKKLNAALARNKGVILVTAHIGNWDLAGVFLSALGYPLSAVVEPVPGDWMKTFNRYRSACAMETIPIPERHRIIQALQKGRVVALVADRDLTGRGILCPAFNAQRSFPRGPAAYSLRYNAPILVGYFVRQKKRNRPPYRGVIYGPINFEPSGEQEKDIVKLTNLVAKELNRIIAMYPDQWLVFKADWQ